MSNFIEVLKQYKTETTQPLIFKKHSARVFKHLGDQMRIEKSVEKLKSKLENYVKIYGEKDFYFKV